MITSQFHLKIIIIHPASAQLIDGVADLGEAIAKLFQITPVLNPLSQIDGSTIGEDYAGARIDQDEARVAFVGRHHQCFIAVP
ncbi:hypothetical protein DSECCO2_634200 [anaerobic digester metagenome]